MLFRSADSSVSTTVFVPLSHHCTLLIIAPTMTLQDSRTQNPASHHHQLPGPTLTKPSMGHVSNKKIPRRSSKPIINWLQRKLAGSVRARRLEESDETTNEFGKAPPPVDKPRARISSAPSPSPTAGHNGTVRNTISLADEDDMPRASAMNHADDRSSYHYSDNASFGSGQEADDDASMRPLPPSSPPSPSPSRSSSSYMSDPRTFRSLAASTKPTTLLSIDLHHGGGGMAHIAQAPAPTPVHLARLQTHGRTGSTQTNPGVHSSGASITFSTLPPTDVTLSRPSSLLAPSAAVQAPLHTAHHPRNNPRPSSPPTDNASVLTLASSAFGIPGAPTRVESSLRSAPLSAGGPADSLSHFGAASVIDGDAASQYVMGFDERLDERDMDASVRALRPRSSRRGSWESEMSRWSARGPLGTPSVARDPSFWTKTEELGADVGDTESVTSASATHQDGVSVVGGKDEHAAQATTPLLGHVSLATQEKPVGEIGKEQAQAGLSSDSSSATTPPANQQQEEPILFTPAEKARQSYATETGVEEFPAVVNSGESRSEHLPGTVSGAASRSDMGPAPSAMSAAPIPTQAN